MASIPKTFGEWLAAVPVAAVAAEADAEGALRLLRPKFASPRLAWLQRLMRRPHFRVKLDARGACFWNHMDGNRTIADIAEIQRLAFGAEDDSAEERAVRFAHQLHQGGFIHLKA